jgi:ADP-ribose pyrophosphatase YjhB (NUDIX family)
MMKIFLLKVWRILPLWAQIIASRIIRPLFQVFSAAVIFDENRRILLVKTTYNRFHPWGLAGGALEYGESAEEAVIREMWEETGMTVEIEKLLLYKTFAPDKFGMYYLCTIKDGVFQPSDEICEYGYFSRENLPDIRPRDHAVINEIYQLMGYKEHELA